MICIYHSYHGNSQTGKRETSPLLVGDSHTMVQLIYHNDTHSKQLILVLEKLSCLRYNITFVQIAMWATELFFQFGGEPHFVFPTSAVYQSQASPQMMSSSAYATPGSSYASPSVLGRAIMGPELVMSGRHQGLCLYIARLIRSATCALKHM